MKRINTRRFINFIIGALFFLNFVSLIFSTGKASAEPPPLLIAKLIARIEALETAVGEQEDLISKYENRIADLEKKLAKVRIDGDVMLFEGVNVQVVNGLGKTNTTNGLGNVIIGYNSEGTGITEKIRDGSHNVIIGNGHEYRAYSELGTTSIVATPGDLDIFSAGSTNFDSQNEFNIIAGVKANIQAGTDINLNANGNATFATGQNASFTVGQAASLVTGKETIIQAGTDINLNADGNATFATGQNASFTVGQAASLVTGKETIIQAGTGLNLLSTTAEISTGFDLIFDVGHKAVISADNDISITSDNGTILIKGNPQLQN